MTDATPTGREETSGVVLIAHRSGGPEDMWRALRSTLAGDRDADASMAEGTAESWGATAADPAALRRLLDAAAENGAESLVLLPVAALRNATLARSDSEAFQREVAEIRRAHPTLDVQAIGFDGTDPDAAARIVSSLQAEQPVDGSVADAALARVFGDRPDDLGPFLAAIRSGLPADTGLYLRGSAVNGESYETGRPFDARGPHTSDLDLVAVGDEASRLWVDEAKLLGGVNTLPLCDGSEWVAPALDPARRSAQAIVERPVSVQSMAVWFLDLRVAVQGQAYISLDPPKG